tara:strand:- start:4593 stop:5012 length:420 start_codon:yes stop_codon:yes gene_type:complete
MAKDQNEKEMKEMYVEYQMITQQVKQTQEQLEKIQEQIADITDVTQNITSLGKVENKKDMFIPIANGIFVETTLKDNKNLLVNVGGDTVVKKSFNDVNEMLGQQQNDLEELHGNLMVQFQQLHQKSEEIEKKLKTFVEK